jgi:hypothetical protein
VCESRAERNEFFSLLKARGFDQYPRAEKVITKPLTNGKVKLLDPQVRALALRSNRDSSAFSAVIDQDGELALKVTFVEMSCSLIAGKVTWGTRLVTDTVTL